MALSIHTNYASLVSQNQLGKTNTMLSTAMERLGTGMRINSAADDAAGLQIAVRLQSQSNGQKVGMRNAQDAISMLQTTEGALTEVTNIAQRMDDIATLASNGTNGDGEYKSLNSEYQNLKAELTNIMQNTQYGEGKKLLAQEVSGAQAGASTVANVNAKTAMNTAVTGLATAQTTFDTAKGIYDGLVTGGTLSAGDQTTFDTATTAYNTAADLVTSTTKTFDEAVIVTESEAGSFASNINFQIGASAGEAMDIDVSGDISDVHTALAALGDVTDQANAKSAMGSTSDLLDAVGALRGQFGASINRLDHTINNLGNMNQNIELSKGRIMDADFASESSNMTKNQLLMQSGMSVLSNANQVSGMVMSLLQ